MSGVTTALKALSNPNRLKVYLIICHAASADREGATIDLICREAGMKQPAVSHHVSRLAQAGLIDRTKTRWWVRCTPAAGGLDALRKFAREPAAFPLE